MWSSRFGVRVGSLKGTNFGLSAAAYPHLKLRDLTPEAADAIYRRDDWQLIMTCSPTR